MTSSVPFSMFTADLRGYVVAFQGGRTARIPFSTLRRDVERAQRRLIEAGVHAGTCVGLMGENCYEWLVYDLAILSLGCIAVCFPQEEFQKTPTRALADRYDLSLLLVTRKLASSRADGFVATLDDPAPWIQRARTPPEGALLARIRGTDVCTVIFSSGTSGKLKALLLSRAGVDATIDALADGWSMSRSDGIFVALPLSIFQQRLMVYAALRRDSDICFTDSVNLFRAFKTLRPTIVLAPPALFENLENRAAAGSRRAEWLRQSASKALSFMPFDGLRRRLRRRLFPELSDALGGNVRVLLTGSAPSKLSTLELFEMSGLPLFQAYGLAEVGFIAWNRPGRNRWLSVGHPVFPGSVSIGHDGEILVSVPHRQAVGYFGVEPEEEGQVFLPDGRVATGDLGRFDDEGYLHITGRKKDLILTQSGHKIHPQSLERELELALSPFVKRAVVVGGGDLPGLVAVLAIDPSAAPAEEAEARRNAETAAAALNKRLPAQSRISRFIVTRVPFQPETGLVTRNLKLDRRAIFQFFEAELLQRRAQAVGAPSP